MGMWNATCAISQLPIQKGEPAVLVLIQESLYRDITECEGRDMMAGPGSMWAPRSIPIRGTYNGYGIVEVEDPEHWTVQLALHRFRLDLVEAPTGERNPIHEPAVVLDEVLAGHDPSWSPKPLNGIEWLQQLIEKDRLAVRVPKWLSQEADRRKRVSVCLIRADIYDDLAAHFTDDGFGQGRTVEFTSKRLREHLGKSSRQGSRDDAGMDHFIKPRMLGAAKALTERTRELLGGDLPELDGMGDSMESMAVERLRAPADRFAEDYASHLLAAGVALDDPTLTNIIEEIAAFTQIQLHMGLLNKFWHPQPQGATGWLSHAAIAMRTLKLAQRHSKQEPE